MNTRRTRRTIAAMATALVAGAGIAGATALPAAADDYYPPYTFNLSEAQVETMKANMDRTDDICGLVPLPYFASLACRNSPAQEEVVNQAYYTDRGIVAKYYISTVTMSLNRYEWQVA